MPISAENFPELKARIEAFIDFVANNDMAHELVVIDLSESEGNSFATIGFKDIDSIEQDKVLLIDAAIGALISNARIAESKLDNLNSIPIVATRIHIDEKKGAVSQEDINADLLSSFLSEDRFREIIENYVSCSAIEDCIDSEHPLIKLHGLEKAIAETLEITNTSAVIDIMKEKGVSLDLLAQELAQRILLVSGQQGPDHVAYAIKQLAEEFKDAGKVVLQVAAHSASKQSLPSTPSAAVPEAQDLEVDAPAAPAH